MERATKILRAGVNMCVHDKAKPKGAANLGSAFVVEDWLRQGAPSNRKEWHMSLMTAQDMEDHLSLRISRQIFMEMHSYGIELVRLPVGYWNFNQCSPNLPDADAEDMSRLQSVMSPGQYMPHIVRAFQLAHEFDMQILLDLHCLPGSQNGEMHSGLRQLPEEEQTHSERSYFDTAHNWKLGLQTLEKITDFLVEGGIRDFCDELRIPLKKVLYGVQVINEPNMDKFRPVDHTETEYDLGGSGEQAQDLTDLMQFYEVAILRMRKKGLPLDIPIVLFAWCSEFPVYLERMKNEERYRFGASEKYAVFGQVIWDTHIYHMGSTNVDEVDENQEGCFGDVVQKIRDAYQNDVDQMQQFVTVEELGNRVIVGEWTLAGVADGSGRKLAWVAEAVAGMFADAGATAHFLWTFGGPGVKNAGCWLMQNVAAKIWDDTRGEIPGPIVLREQAEVFKHLFAWDMRADSSLAAADTESASKWHRRIVDMLFVTVAKVISLLHGTHYALRQAGVR
eukprot:TRINITY_DN23317_c0_g1_i1.p1 TRINITY_DN23317_c0_g1~~TRINITY_DN23317_c0_g1_i1.p1  ORF type:complete len:506 (+),score=90.60 TRINITY_DN23317_c0_g1_i1:38-1555(+)